jgi:hypothetical protein
MPEKTNVHGFTVNYETNAYEGIRYLRDDLDFEEARVFFDQARLRGFAQFEDDQDRQYTLYYRDGIYTLARR